VDTTAQQAVALHSATTTHPLPPATCHLPPATCHLPPATPQHKELGPSARAAQELAALRREQLALERDSGQALFLGLPLAATLAQCLRLGHAKAAAQLRRSFGVSEQRWWWLRLRGACEARDWEALEGLAAEKRAPVAGGGWEPLLEAARRAGAPREVVGRCGAGGAAGRDVCCG
jgi:hypothetical protein